MRKLLTSLALIALLLVPSKLVNADTTSVVPTPVAEGFINTDKEDDYHRFVSYAGMLSGRMYVCVQLGMWDPRGIPAFMLRVNQIIAEYGGTVKDLAMMAPIADVQFHAAIANMKNDQRGTFKWCRTQSDQIPMFEELTRLKAVLISHRTAVPRENWPDPDEVRAFIKNMKEGLGA